MATQTTPYNLATREQMVAAGYNEAAIEAAEKLRSWLLAYRPNPKPEPLAWIGELLDESRQRPAVLTGVPMHVTI